MMWSFVACTSLLLRSPSEPLITRYVHPTLIDGNGGAPIVDAAIVVRGNEILYAGSLQGAPNSGRSRTINLKGKFVIPGLWDMHTHVDDPELLELDPNPEEKAQWFPLFILNGVTGIREMAGDLALMHTFRDRIARKELLGPRLWCGGPLVDGPKPMWPGSIAVDSPEKGRQVVRDLKARGANFIKAYSLLPRDAFLAICDEAKKIHIPVCGHVPYSVTNLEACDAGLNSMEHLLQLDRELADPDKVKSMRSEIPPGEDRFARFRSYAEIDEKCYSPSLAQNLFAEFRARKVWICPTLIVAFRDASFPFDPAELARRRQYVPAYVREWWDPTKNVHLRDQNADLRAGQQTIFRIYKRIVFDLKKAGIPMMTGSDMGGNPDCYGGWGVHDEMALLVEAGLTPMEAILAATSNPAKYLGVYDRLGSVQKGKLADFVVLDRNPLRDIHNSTAVDSVVYDGHDFDHPEISKLLEVQKLSTKKRLKKSLPSK